MHSKLSLSLLAAVSLATSACATAPALSTQPPPMPTQPPPATRSPISPTQAPNISPTSPPSPTPTMPSRATATGPTTPEPRPTQPFRPQPGDESLSRGAVFLDEASLIILKTLPVQVVLRVTGSTPTPCHHLRAQAAKPDAQNRIRVDVYSVVDPNAICIQMLSPVDESVPLGSFPPGTYTVYVNGAEIGSFSG